MFMSTKHILLKKKGVILKSIRAGYTFSKGEFLKTRTFKKHGILC